jgi:hypothetical protein
MNYRIYKTDWKVGDIFSLEESDNEYIIDNIAKDNFFIYSIIDTDKNSNEKEICSGGGSYLKGFKFYISRENLARKRFKILEF